MTTQVFVTSVLGAAGWACMAVAIRNERRMHRHRQEGVTYGAATFRRDGGWRRTDLFTPEGLAFQRRAARYGMIGLSFWILALIAWIVLARA